jgi:hypothetical protein
VNVLTRAGFVSALSFTTTRYEPCESFGSLTCRSMFGLAVPEIAESVRDTRRTLTLYA